MANCNLSYIESGTFQGLASLKYLNCSHNEALGFPSLRNVSFGLQETDQSSGLFKSLQKFGLNTELRRCDIWYLRNTTIQELNLDNRLALIEINALHLFPPNFKIVFVELNLFTFGPFVVEMGCLQNLERLEINQQYYFAYRRLIGVKEK